MPANQRPDRLSGRPPARVDPRVPAPRAPGSAPIHPGQEIQFVQNQGREYWWEQLGTQTRERLLSRVGEIIEWWAYIFDGGPTRPYAVVLGQRGLAMTKPTINERGGPAQRLMVWPLREASHRFARVTGLSAGDPTTAPPSWDHSPSSRATPVEINLPEPDRGFLGNLPKEAQEKLQGPFLSGDPIRQSDFYYEGHPERLDIWFCLAGSRSVTFASGAGMLKHRRRRIYSWELVCRQADVVESAR